MRNLFGFLTESGIGLVLMFLIFLVLEALGLLQPTILP